MRATSKFKRSPLEKYYTPAWPIEALIRSEDMRGRWVDPAAGAGHIMDVLNAAGVRCDGFDIAPDAPHVSGPLDFLVTTWIDGPGHYGTKALNIITNPPFGTQGRLAVKFIEHALKLTEPTGGKVIMLLHADFDAAKTRRHLFADHPAFARQYTLTDRLQWANLEDQDRSSSNHAWFVWDWYAAGRHCQRAHKCYLHRE